MDKVIAFFVLVLFASCLMMPALIIANIWINWSPFWDKVLLTNIVVLLTSMVVSVILLNQ